MAEKVVTLVAADNGVAVVVVQAAQVAMVVVPKGARACVEAKAYVGGVRGVAQEVGMAAVLAQVVGAMDLGDAEEAVAVVMALVLRGTVVAVEMVMESREVVGTSVEHEAKVGVAQEPAAKVEVE